jgi:PIN like domain
VDTLTFYFDVCFGRRFPEALRHTRPPFNVEYHHKAKFKQTMKDDDWLALCGQRNWIAFSHDRKWHLIEVEIAAIKRHGVGCFYLWGANESTFEKLQCFMGAYDVINSAARDTPMPFIYNVPRNCRLEQIEIP